tara:strand:- start:3375 stop:4997 length:1623 start_codon:yes stop_codon:yes gene_type:complete
MSKPYQISKHNHLHIVPRIAVADSKAVAQCLIYEMSNDETEIIEALAQLLDMNRNEIGKNISAIVATATLPVNRQENYIFDEHEFAQKILSHLSQNQLDALQEYNTAKLENKTPDSDTLLIRETFGTPELLKTNEGNSYLANFLRTGQVYAQQTDLEIPSEKPELTEIESTNLALCTISMCLRKKFMPLMRHDGSHIHSGYNTSVSGEIYNQTYDLASNSLAQYGVIPNMREQILNRKVICSFFGLPPKLQNLTRDWQEYQKQALEIWRDFLEEQPQYAEAWGLENFLDHNMKMVKADGTPIISLQTGEQQIPVIDYTDIAVLNYLEQRLDEILSDEEVFAQIPYQDIYHDMLISLELLSMEFIRRDGKPFQFKNGIYDACATFKDVAYNKIDAPIVLQSLSSPHFCETYDTENIDMKKKRNNALDNNQWCGYMVDLEDSAETNLWVTEQAPCLHVLYPDSVTIHRVTLPLEAIQQCESTRGIFGGSGYLVPQNVVQINSQLCIRNHDKIPDLKIKKGSISSDCDPQNTNFQASLEYTSY